MTDTDAEQDSARTEVRVLLGLGSNQGEPTEQFATAVALLQGVVDIDAVSSLYRSAPVGFTDQPDFLNVVVAGRTRAAPGLLLAAAQRIEARMGRVRSFRNAPRVIDIDLLAYGDYVIRTADLTIPHPGIPARNFVLYPLAEVAPDWVHPELGTPVSELLARAGALERIERLSQLSIWIG